MKNLKFALIAGACTTVAALVGCDTSSKSGTTLASVDALPDQYYPGGKMVTKVTEKPAPAAKAEAKPAAKADAKPAPKASGNMNRMFLPTGAQSTSAVMVERASPSEVVVGQQTEYTIKVTNLTPDTIKGVTVNDECLENFTIKESSPAGVVRGSTTTWNLGDLGPNESKTITVRGTPTKAGSFTSCADVRWNNILCATTNVVQPALAITKIITPESILNCGTITTTIDVRNTGSGTASNVVVTDNLPAGLTTTDGQSSVTINLGNLAAGQSASRPITLKAAKTGKYDNTASVKADGGLTATSATVSTVVKQPVLAVSCATDGNVYIGRDGSGSVTIKNTGDACVDNASVMISTNGTMTRVDGGTVNGANGTWNVGKLCGGETKTVKFSVKPTGNAAVNITANATGTCATAVQSACTFNVIGTPDIGTSISDNDGVITVGNPHVYTYTVVNQGQVDLTNVKVVGTLDAGSDYVGTNWAIAPTVAGKAITWNVGTVKVGERKTFTVTIKGTTEGEHGIETVTSCNEFKRTVRNDEQVNYIK